MPSPTPTYGPAEQVLVGRIEGREQTVYSVPMPRARFMRLVRQILRAKKYDALPKRERAQLLKTAETMPRFPMSSWLTDRGCGCVVGEYLVARDVIERSAGRSVNIRNALGKLPGDTGQLLETFGIDIDNAVRREVKRGWDTAKAGYFPHCGSARLPHSVNSVELV